MIPVYQTRFGGLSAPREEQGNCFQASLASILEPPLEEAFDCVAFDEAAEGSRFEHQPWFEALQSWLAEYGLAAIYQEVESLPVSTSYCGYHIAEVKSRTLQDGSRHAVVLLDGVLVHDPNPNSQGLTAEDFLAIYLLIPLNPATFRKK